MAKSSKDNVNVYNPGIGVKNIIKICLEYSSRELSHGKVKIYKHATFSSCMRDKLALILDEATFLVESYLHSLLDNLANRDQILCDCRDMQYILQVALVVVIVKGHISNVLNRVRVVITSLHHAGSLGFP